MVIGTKKEKMINHTTVSSSTFILTCLLAVLTIVSPASAMLATSGLQGQQKFHTSGPFSTRSHGGNSALMQHFQHRREVAELWGLPKLVWVILADVVAMILFIVAIPVVLNCAKRRRPLFR
ncbi:unnamed protein product [Amoebophrya sp. A120]|nr:unnamed protein product [Amoebophrya sp. A120]|eukprot:GSA120T00000496001.1